MNHVTVAPWLGSSDTAWYSWASKYQLQMMINLLCVENAWRSEFARLAMCNYSRRISHT